MKQLGRTIFGKTLLFLITVILLCVGLFAAHLTMKLNEEGLYEERDTGILLRAKVWEADDEYLVDASWQVMSEVLQEVQSSTEVVRYPTDSFPVCFRILDEAGNIVATTEQYNTSGGATEVHDFWYGILKNGDPSTPGDSFYVVYAEDDMEAYDAFYYVDCYSLEEPPRSVEDRITLWFYKNSIKIPIFSIVSVLAGILMLVWLLCVSGRRPYTEDVVPGALHPVPYDVLTVAGILIIVFVYEIGTRFFIRPLLSGLMLFLVVALFVGNAMSLACRIKRRELVRQTLLYKVGSWLGDLVHGLPLVGRFLLTIGLFAGLDLGITWLLRVLTDANLLYWLVKHIFLVPVLLWTIICFKKLQKGSTHLASGDLEYHIDTRRMPYDLKELGENLNGFAQGMSSAVDRQVRSERMKTELLTNVSHDIKTPLTSIINYADLISKEGAANENIRQYAEVLTRQSARLKRLLEDLVEASKASTGNLEIIPELCNTAVLLQQAAGEYEERMESLGLRQVLELPEQEILIMADGRRMWRIFDNLMNNICKYAMPQTRVYIRLERQGDSCVMSFSNVSRDPLNVDEEELMERFVRGDRSRNAEGSGLGLSIARSLAELQKGKLEIRIDGDLFKAVLTFPIAEA